MLGDDHEFRGRESTGAPKKLLTTLVRMSLIDCHHTIMHLRLLSISEYLFAMIRYPRQINCSSNQSVVILDGSAPNFSRRPRSVRSTRGKSKSKGKGKSKSKGKAGGRMGSISCFKDTRSRHHASLGSI